jgi:hypothetical protein
MTVTQNTPATAEGLLKDVKTFFDHGEFFRDYERYRTRGKLGPIRECGDLLVNPPAAEV